MKHPVGYFEAASSNHILETVIVSQWTHLDCENQVVAFRKIFTVGSVDGEELFRAKDPNIFLKRDGTLLKKIGDCRVYNRFTK